MSDPVDEVMQEEYRRYHRENLDAINRLQERIETLTGKISNGLQAQMNATTLSVQNLKTTVDLSVKYLIPMVIGVVSLLIGLVAGKAGF